MKILLVYPSYPDTFWSFKHALKFVFKKATNPPLGLMTVAAMLPGDWPKKLVDMNVQRLNDRDLRWADLVFISAMSIQKGSAREIINRCRELGKKTVCGGPLFTTGRQDFDDADYLVLNEAEINLPRFLEDLEKGEARRVYDSAERADLTKTPAPLWRLVKKGRYGTMNIQYSRGCPFDCEFCDITLLYGHAPRTKSREQVLAELEGLYRTGWRGSVFFVDDNFIGNKRKLKTEILPALAEWMEKKHHPFAFITQASMELADDDELMSLMSRAGFDTVFMGIETPNEESLKECNKYHNQSRDLIACVKKIQGSGLQVMGGFIVGFDNDPATIFERQIKFIQKSGIVTAMVSLLNALRGTKLYQRLIREKRLVAEDHTGSSIDCTINFKPRMDREELIAGYQKIAKTLYTPKYYYERVRTFLKQYRPRPKKTKIRFDLRALAAFLRSNIRLGVIGRERVHYWRLLVWTMFQSPKLIGMSVSFAIYGFHFRKIYAKYR
jgi:radical SAM superfamily enzyme YgiQ (UPF0313 family)